MDYIAKLPECTASSIWECKELQPNETIRKIYKTGEVALSNGTKKKISSAVSPTEGYILYSLIKLNRYKDILEVGFCVDSLCESSDAHTVCPRSI